jgi:hypothetical protein
MSINHNHTYDLQGKDEEDDSLVEELNPPSHVSLDAKQ